MYLVRMPLLLRILLSLWVLSPSAMQWVCYLQRHEGDNPETLDNPNANGAAGDKLGSVENLTGSDYE